MKQLLFIFIVVFGIAVIYGQESVFAADTHDVQIIQNSYNKGCEIKENCYLPSKIFAKAGDTVTWTNNDDALHTVTSGSPLGGSDKVFDSGLLETNNSFSYTFNEDNKSYSYYCVLHPWMIGYVVIGDAQIQKIEIPAEAKTPTVLDADFKIEKFASGLSVPTTMAFVGDDILVLQKNDGKVRLIRNGILQNEPVLDVEVSNYGEQGLLGITNVGSKVYLFFTESFHDGGLSLENRIYKYDWDGQKLSNPSLVKRLPSDEVTYNGGAMVSDSESTVYAVTGEDYKAGVLQNHLPSESYRHFSENARSDEKARETISDSLKQTASCLKVSFKHYTTNPAGWQPKNESIRENPWESNPLFILANIESCIKKFVFNELSFGNWKDTSVILQVDPPGDYAAIGIRNSFGLAIDPVTGYLWDTENGPDKFDEINLISKKFNSGWSKVAGPSAIQLQSLPGYEDYKYADPKFSWESPIGITGVSFANSEQFTKYKDWLFIGDSNNGNIYKFRLNDDRTGFVFNSPHLQDLVVNIDTSMQSGSINEPMDEILFATNFGLISDIEFGPDGALYVVSLLEGTIYRITTT
jgi:glucose/arabinose dehydrogenase